MFFKLIVVYRVSANSLFTLNGNEDSCFIPATGDQ